MFVVVFIYDILFYSHSETDQEEHLRVVLQTVKDPQLFTKFRNFEFWLKSISFFGHIVSDDSI